MMLMDQLENAFPALSTTALGAKFAVQGLNYCSNKNKKKIVKSYKGMVVDTCVHQFGYDFYDDNLPPSIPLSHLHLTL